MRTMKLVVARTLKEFIVGKYLDVCFLGKNIQYSSVWKEAKERKIIV